MGEKDGSQNEFYRTLIRIMVSNMKRLLDRFKLKPVRGFVIEICDDLRTYPEEWSRCSTYEWMSSSKTYSKKTYSKGGIKITRSLSKDSVVLELYNHREFEYIHLTRKEKSRLYNATLSILFKGHIMKFIILTTGADDYFDDRPDVKLPINPEQIVLLKDISDHSDYMTEVELSNGSVLMVYESIQDILDMINEG